MILIIGGTTEGRIIYDRIKDTYETVISVAGETGTFMEKFENCIVGRKSKDDFAAYIKKEKIDKVIDASHPFAVNVSANIKEACKDTGIEYIRFTRDVSDIKNDKRIIKLKSYKEAFDYIKKLSKQNILMTTGSNMIAEFEKNKADNRLIYRILPTVESIQSAYYNGVEMRNIIAELGPFTLEQNIALIKRYNINFLFSKDSGKRGGTSEKINACLQEDINCVIITRDKEEGFNDLNELLLYLERRS